MGAVGADERAARRAAAPHLVALGLMALMLGALALLRPEWARSYAWLVGAIAVLPFLHTIFLGTLTDGWIAPRPFGLRPVATVVAASGLFAAAASGAPEAVADLGPATMGFLVGVLLVAVVVRRLATLLD